VRYIGVFALVLCVSGCAPRFVRRVQARDFSMVREGRYGNHVEIRNGDSVLVARVHYWRDRIEDDPEFLPRIAEKFYYIPGNVRFHFTYVGEDRSRDAVVLRYFAYAPKPVIIAGWQVQFVFDGSTRRLREVLTTEVPLE
jgi:hypothetical protein